MGRPTKRTVGTKRGERRPIIDSPYIDAGRRAFLRKSFMSCLSITAMPVISGCSDSDDGAFESLFVEPPVPSGMSNVDNLGPLGPADANGLMLPEGFTSRVIARSGEEPVPGAGYIWHDSPDGGAVFPVDDGGWVYTSNSEIFQPRGLAGAGALRFDDGGNLISAYSILQNTSANCAGGSTPWGT